VLVDKKLGDDGLGDFAIVSGAANFKQQLKHRIATPRGQARRHPEYGCLAWSLIGSVNGPVAGALAAQHVKAALLADYRVASVSNVTAEIVGDAVRASARADGIAGGSVDLTGLS
jgi:phage baseplate assembly protein W